MRRTHGVGEGCRKGGRHKVAKAGKKRFEEMGMNGERQTERRSTVYVV